uniref:Uncharacterized protein n=1 Tax=Chromera velia CCMP2878 TaxID=1169474 RepID=A0A0G4I7T6_9ALVE|eukprot:Cvel_11778.t1-p1 / transcript=Cvel_11778.t1 / gene=Cvel_11778 / organism=Chromera_velia_CCMP2878 / gene_product=Calponin homology domain-containing protein, putative / transcript_product=Calponin homology domain-containing protein, putative / location=Cvel_scaffold749:17125-30064(-) / protein_length=1171 / sequence_SO=supercontig / SO=protein_coding / is_pseudo=false
MGIKMGLEECPDFPHPGIPVNGLVLPFPLLIPPLFSCLPSPACFFLLPPPSVTSSFPSSLDWLMAMTGRERTLLQCSLGTGWRHVARRFLLTFMLLLSMDSSSRVVGFEFIWRGGVSVSSPSFGDRESWRVQKRRHPHAHSLFELPNRQSRLPQAEEPVSVLLGAPPGTSPVLQKPFPFAPPATLVLSPSPSPSESLTVGVGVPFHERQETAQAGRVWTERDRRTRGLTAASLRRLRQRQRLSSSASPSPSPLSVSVGSPLRERKGKVVQRDGARVWKKRRKEKKRKKRETRKESEALDDADEVPSPKSAEEEREASPDRLSHPFSSLSLPSCASKGTVPRSEERERGTSFALSVGQEAEGEEAEEGQEEKTALERDERIHHRRLKGSTASSLQPQPSSPLFPFQSSVDFEETTVDRHPPSSGKKKKKKKKKKTHSQSSSASISSGSENRALEMEGEREAKVLGGMKKRRDRGQRPKGEKEEHCGREEKRKKKVAVSVGGCKSRLEREADALGISFEDWKELKHVSRRGAHKERCRLLEKFKSILSRLPDKVRSGLERPLRRQEQYITKNRHAKLEKEARSLGLTRDQLAELRRVARRGPLSEKERLLQEYEGQLPESELSRLRKNTEKRKGHLKGIEGIRRAQKKRDEAIQREAEEMGVSLEDWKEIRRIERSRKPHSQKRKTLIHKYANTLCKDLLESLRKRTERKRVPDEYRQRVSTAMRAAWSNPRMRGKLLTSVQKYHLVMAAKTRAASGGGEMKRKQDGRKTKQARERMKRLRAAMEAKRNPGKKWESFYDHMAEDVLVEGGEEEEEDEEEEDEEDDGLGEMFGFRERKKQSAQTPPAFSLSGLSLLPQGPGMPLSALGGAQADPHASPAFPLRSLLFQETNPVHAVSSDHKEGVETETDEEEDLSTPLSRPLSLYEARLKEARGRKTEGGSSIFSQKRRGGGLQEDSADEGGEEEENIFQKANVGGLVGGDEADNFEETESGVGKLYAPSSFDPDSRSEKHSRGERRDRQDQDLFPDFLTSGSSFSVAKREEEEEENDSALDPPTSSFVRPSSSSMLSASFLEEVLPPNRQKKETMSFVREDDSLGPTSSFSSSRNDPVGGLEEEGEEEEEETPHSLTLALLGEGEEEEPGGGERNWWDKRQNKKKKAKKKNTKKKGRQKVHGA